MLDEMSLNNLNWTAEYYEKNVAECNTLLNSLENFERIPFINYVSLQNFADGALVRYRGMIQDMLNPEYYSPFYTVVNLQSNESYERSGKFIDIPHCKANEELKASEAKCVPKERQVFFCIPIPGSNDWVENYLKQKCECTFVKEESSGIKRKTSECNEGMDITVSETTIASPSPAKKTKSNEEESTASQSSIYSVAKHFPFNEENGLSCLIKTYDNEEKSDLVLNNVIEVVGFLSLNPALEANWDDADLEDKGTHPPPSLVPRIHAIHVKKLKHCNPLIKENISCDLISDFVENARSELQLIFTQLLFEDVVAADFLLCHLISRVYIRNDEHTLGKFSLNLCNVKHKDFGTCLNSILQIIVTNSHYIPLSIQMLNDSNFVPKKDYESNRLWSGILQLSDDTHLILDETKMNEGQLNNQGCLNVMALQKLFREQVIQYDFGYYPVSYNTNIPLLVISEGKSMFEADIIVKVKSHVTDSILRESYEAVRAYLSEEIANKLRIYLTSVRLLDFQLGEEMAKKIGEEYVSMRQQNEKVTSYDLHNLLVLSRLLALSHGRGVLNEGDWSRAVEMEAERKSRLG